MNDAVLNPQAGPRYEYAQSKCHTELANKLVSCFSNTRYYYSFDEILTRYIIPGSLYNIPAVYTIHLLSALSYPLALPRLFVYVSYVMLMAVSSKRAHL